MAFLMPQGLCHRPWFKLLARSLGCDLDTALGRFWQLLDHVFGVAKDGNLSDIPPAHLAIVLNWDKPAEELYPFLISIGALKSDLTLVEAEEMTRNYREATRKRESRENAKSSIPLAQPSLFAPDTSASVPDAGVTRPDATGHVPPKDRRIEGKKESEAPAPPSPALTFASFPVTGEGEGAPPWPLTEAHVRQLESVWVGLDVRGELRKLAVAIEQGARPRRTRNGYPRAIHNWLTKAAEFAKAPLRSVGGGGFNSGGGHASPAPRVVKPFIDEPGAKG